MCSQFEITRGKPRVAKMLLDAAAAVDQQSPHLWLQRAKLHLRTGQLSLAQNAIDDGLKYAPKYAPLWHLQGVLLERLSRLDEARACYAHGLDLSPRFAQIFHSWARLEANVFNYEALSRLDHLAREAFPPSGGQTS